MVDYVTHDFCFQIFRIVITLSFTEKFYCLGSSIVTSAAITSSLSLVPTKPFRARSSSYSLLCIAQVAYHSLLYSLLSHISVVGANRLQMGSKPSRNSARPMASRTFVSVQVPVCCLCLGGPQVVFVLFARMLLAWIGTVKLEIVPLLETDEHSE